MSITYIHTKPRSSITKDKVMITLMLSPDELHEIDCAWKRSDFNNRSAYIRNSLKEKIIEQSGVVRLSTK